MTRQPVRSSNIRSVGYDIDSHELEIEFHHGGIYLFHNVPPMLYHALMAAPSKGSYFARYIKEIYEFTHIA